MKVTIDEFSKDLTKILKEYADIAEDELEKAVDETAKEAVKSLKKANPPGSGKYQSWRKYNSSWTKKKGVNAKGKTNVTVYNKEHYRLTHLLEHGHKVPGGSAKAFPHIAEVDAMVEEKVMALVKKGL